ncbi:MAG: hypothetical protein COB66_02875 [Coxiella sp. (in: Bacteria)]|nr:MAG: hypothetical protein COB66_02875 [Coxiella sp. (in: g-proteobacteria)]
MAYRTIQDIIASNPELKRAYTSARIVSMTGTACLIASLLLLVYQFMYSNTRTNMIIWAALLIISIFLSFLGRKMMRNVAYVADRIKAKGINDALDKQQEPPEY